jgi:hypothetical protein
VSNYGVCDKNMMLYFVINVVKLGKIKKIAPNDKNKSDNSHDTTVTYGNQIIVSHDLKNIAPIGLIAIRTEWTGGRNYLNFGGKLIELNKIYASKCEKKVELKKLFNDYYLINNKLTIGLIKGINSYIIMPFYLLKNKLYIDSIDNLLFCEDNYISIDNII